MKRYEATLVSGKYELKAVLITNKELDKNHTVKLVGYGAAPWKITDIKIAENQKPQIGDTEVL